MNFKTLKYFLFVFPALVLAGCNKIEHKNPTLQNNLLKANSIIHQMNSLNAADLKKIHTRGCIHNCLPWKTFSELMDLESKLVKTGHYADWDTTTKRYFISARN